MTLSRFEWPVNSDGMPLVNVSFTMLPPSHVSGVPVSSDLSYTLTPAKPFFLPPHTEMRIRCRDGKLIVEFV